MTPLVLVRHARTRLDPASASRDWRLAPGAAATSRRLAALVANDLGGSGIDRVVTSHEPKAIETGTALAAAWSVPCQAADDLHEHDRSGTPVLTEAQWRAAIERLFAEPHATILGRESAAGASERFERGLRRVLADHPAEALAVVTHGTVLACFLARHNRLDAHRLWRTLRMPEAFYLERATFRLTGRRSL